MNNRQQRIYDYIESYIEINKYSPSFREVADGVGLKSSSTIHTHLKQMKKDGYIDFVNTLPRTLRIVV